MKLINGIALYGVDDLTLYDAFEVANKLFAMLNLTPNCLYYFYRHVPDKDGETVSAKDVTMADLEDHIRQGDICNFRIYYCLEERLWDVGFAFTTKESEFGEEMSMIEIQFPNQLLEIGSQAVQELLSSVSQKTKITYGIGYQVSGDMSVVASYAVGLGVVVLYPYEHSGEWTYQLPSRCEEPQYTFKLRMVYPLNLLNSQHLSLLINGIRLSDWIQSDPQNGQLTSLHHDTVLWTVNAEELDRINHLLGQAELLISW